MHVNEGYFFTPPKRVTSPMVPGVPHLHVKSPEVDTEDSCILCFIVSLLLCLDSQSVILLLWEMLLMGLAVLMTSLLELLAVI